MNPDDPVPSKEESSLRHHTPDMDSELPPGADAEERFNNFWRENGTSIFVSIAIAAVVVIGIQVWRYAGARAEEHAQTAFVSAGTTEELIAFAEDHSKHPLAGAAYIRVADDEYNSGQFKQATEHYLLAKDKLSGTPFYERAALGAAISEFLGGNVETGISDLRALLDNPDNLEITRAEAAFNLALYYLQKQDYKDLTGIIEIADTFGEKNAYAAMTRSFRNQIPEEK